MSNVLLFVYPDKRYFEQTQKCHHYDSPEQFQNAVKRLNQLIDERYRSRGFQVVWLVFSRQDKPGTPDISRISDLVKLVPGDLIVPAGITKDMLDKGVYADPEYVLSQLPTELSRVAVGGFHALDCVAKITKHLHQNTSAESVVDFDLTDMFFLQRGVGIKVPTVRLVPYGVASLAHLPLEMRATLRGKDTDGPWLEQRNLFPLTVRERFGVVMAAPFALYLKHNLLLLILLQNLGMKIDLFKFLGDVQVLMSRPRGLDGKVWHGSRSRESLIDEGPLHLSYGVVCEEDGVYLALDFNSIPPGVKSNEEAAEYIESRYFHSRRKAKRWIEERARNSPRSPLEPLVEAG